MTAASDIRKPLVAPAGLESPYVCDDCQDTKWKPVNIGGVRRVVRERTLDSPTDKIMLSLTAFADELEREKARQRTFDALLRKAQGGYVTGGRVFG